MTDRTVKARFQALAFLAFAALGLPLNSWSVDHGEFFHSLDARCKKPIYEACRADWYDERRRCARRDTRQQEKECLWQAKRDYRHCELSYDGGCLSSQAKWLGKIHKLLSAASQHYPNVDQILQACVDEYFARALPTRQMIEHCVRIETSAAGRKHKPPGAAAVSIDIRCAETLRCEDMHSRVEAAYHFQYCGLKSLDLDRNGAPCDEQ